MSPLPVALPWQDPRLQPALDRTAITSCSKDGSPPHAQAPARARTIAIVERQMGTSISSESGRIGTHQYLRLGRGMQTNAVLSERPIEVIGHPWFQKPGVLVVDFFVNKLIILAVPANEKGRSGGECRGVGEEEMNALNSSL